MLQFQPSREEFIGLSRQANAIPVYASLLSDRLTPVSAFEMLSQDSEHSFLLESVVGGEKIARYSFLGTLPLALLESSGQVTTVRDANQVAEVFKGIDPLQKLEEMLSAYQAVHPTGLPRFLGGAVGYAGYDIVRHYERLGPGPKDDRGLPDMQFGIYDQMVVFDHVRKIVNVVAHGHIRRGVEAGKAYDQACRRVELVVGKLADAGTEALKPLIEPSADGMEFQSNVPRSLFERAVDRCQEYIRAGDIFQVVISQRLTSSTRATPFDVYRALRVINPSPFMFYVQSPSVTLVGASPEILCRIEGRTVSTRPLAGTRPRGRSETEDRGLEADLLADPKERAEHIMLVDLGRNDLGRICEPGSVKVDDLMSIERYSHVMHICSNVVGTLAEGRTAFDALRSVLPVVTVSGAPKVRAMQIIDELETVRRGPYAGAVGYVDFGGNMDTCIALRTLVITPAGAGGFRVDAQVGAGIVADSVASREFQETLSKAQSMLSALHLANSWQRETGN
jgi:anthranilate synthase component 1